MPPPAVPIDSRPPPPPPPPSNPNFNFNPQNGPSCSFTTGPSSTSARPKLKPRLVKLRKSSKLAQTLDTVDSGSNPFRLSDSGSNEFVFGGSNSSCDVNINKINGVGNDSELNGVEGLTFRFGAGSEARIDGNDVKCGENGVDFEVIDGMNKLNIDNVEKGSCGLSNRNVSENGDRVFVFKTGGAGSEPVESDVNVRNNDNVFVFGSSETGTEPGSFKFDSIRGENEGSRGSISGFELPDFDPSVLFSGKFSSGLDRKSESSVRHRGLKDKHSKKPKGKSNKNVTKLQPVQNPVSSEGVVQGHEAPECYSPMDFSPYEDTTNGAVPTESRLNDNGTDFELKMNGPSGGGGGDGNGFCFGSDKTSASENHVSSSKRTQRRKYRMKPASVSAGTSKGQGFPLNGTPLSSKMQGVGGNNSASVSKNKHKTEVGDEMGYEAYSDAEKACEKWRRRGNEAYENGELSKAEEFYTWGVNCVPQGIESGVGFRPLVRCYSNRAAARMALGRVREAIQDCLMAVKFDPSFYRAQIRAANCYLQLGEVENAIQCFDKCLGSGNVVCLDRQFIISASEGIQKSQKLTECTDHSTELLKLRTSDAATDALQYISEAMSISVYSERLLELKAQALCMLSKHEEVITLCHKTLEFAEKNFTDSNHGYQEVDSVSNIKLWRYRTLAKCHFHLGNLESALDILEKQEFQNKTQEPLAVTIHELLKHKSAGNSAFHSGKHVEAIEHYTLAIHNSMESRPFAAICFCNRAASYQALGQITDAISDCSLAIALNESYAKAVSRRATLHEMIRDYKQAVDDLQKLLSIQKQSLEKSKHSGSGKGKELRQVQQRLSVMEQEAKNDTPLDFYLILGSKKCDSVSEIKKAYRKSALRHHPDKAAQSLVKSGEIGEEGRHWKDIAELVHKDSDRLFKMIGEAYAVLSDPTKREEYDLDEDMRKALKESNNIRTNSMRYSEHYSQGYPFERSSSRRYWQDTYKTYSYSYRR